MPNWGYSVGGLDPLKTAKASGRDLKISPKASREICNAIRHMKLEQAKTYLHEVVEMKRAVPFKRHKKEVPHRRGVEGWYAARYPIKASKAVLKVLEGLEANAGEKGLDAERLRLVHAAAERGRKLKKSIPRAHGRSSPFNQELTHLELIVQEI